MRTIVVAMTCLFSLLAYAAVMRAATPIESNCRPLR